MTAGNVVGRINGDSQSHEIFPLHSTDQDCKRTKGHRFKVLISKHLMAVYYSVYNNGCVYIIWLVYMYVYAYKRTLLNLFMVYTIPTPYYTH